MLVGKVFSEANFGRCAFQFCEGWKAVWEKQEVPAFIAPEGFEAQEASSPAVLQN